MIANQLDYPALEKATQQAERRPRIERKMLWWRPPANVVRFDGIFQGFFRLVSRESAATTHCKPENIIHFV